MQIELESSRNRWTQAALVNAEQAAPSRIWVKTMRNHSTLPICDRRKAHRVRFDWASGKTAKLNPFR
jgi:hypothetical protein